MDHYVAVVKGLVYCTDTVSYSVDRIYSLKKPMMNML